MKTQINRLQKLAEHLLKGELGLDKFNFNDYYMISECRTQGCALGECPTLFPEDWEFNEAKCPVLKSFRERTDGSRRPQASGMEFFGLSAKEYKELFIPNADASVTGIKLGTKATKEEVAGRILLFCQIKSQEQTLGMDEIEMLRPAGPVTVVNYEPEQIDEETLELAEV